MTALKKILNFIGFFMKILLDFKYDAKIIVRWLQGTERCIYYNYITNLEVLSLFIDLIFVSIDSLFSNLGLKYKILLFSLFFISFDLFQYIAYETVIKSTMKQRRKRIREEIINFMKGFGNYIAAITFSFSIFNVFKKIRCPVKELEQIQQHNIFNVLIRLICDFIIVFVIFWIYPKTKEIKPKSYKPMRHIFLYTLLSFVLNLNFIVLVTLIIYFLFKLLML